MNVWCVALLCYHKEQIFHPKTPPCTRPPPSPPPQSPYCTGVIPFLDCPVIRTYGHRASSVLLSLSDMHCVGHI